MKLSVKPSLRPEARRLLALGALLLLVQASACVSASKHEEVVGERDALARARAELDQRAGNLEVSNSSLEAERVQLYDELEDLRLEREALAATRAALERDVMRLNDSQDQLNRQLETTSAALSAATREVGDLKSTFEGLVEDLETELQQGAIEIEQLRSGLRVAVSDEILFRSGSAKLDSGGSELLHKVAANIKDLDYAIDVEGHTDNVPILGPLKKRYPSNWELAGARAASVVRLFEAAGIAGPRLQAISRAEHAPVTSNDDAEGRSMNRRIEILLRPRDRVAPLGAAADAADTAGVASPSATSDARDSAEP